MIIVGTILTSVLTLFSTNQIHTTPFFNQSSGVKLLNCVHSFSTMAKLRKDGDVIAMGIEGSANKLAVGIIRYRQDGETNILSNPRKTYITPPGQGFLPRETAWHHQNHVVAIVRASLKEAGVTPAQIDCICYTKGPGMGGPLRSAAVCARMLSLLWKKPLVGVNHCVGRTSFGVSCFRCMTD